MQKWGANSSRQQRNRYSTYKKIKKGVINQKSGVVKSQKVLYPKCSQTITQQSRVTHPAWMYKDLEQNNRYPLFLNPQENVCIPFHNNLNTRLLERDYFVPEIPCLNLM